MKNEIIYVCPYFPPFGSGGAERTAFLHSKVLIENGYNVTVVTPNYGLRNNSEKSLKIITFDIGKKLKLGEQLNSRIFYNPIIQNKLKKIILENFLSHEVKCIHVQHQFLLSGASAAARELGVPLISHVRDTGTFCSLGGCCLIYNKPNQIPAFRYSIQHHIWCYFKNWIKYQKIQNKFFIFIGFLRSFIPYFIYLKNHIHLKRSKKIVFASKNLRDLYKNSFKNYEINSLNYVYAIANDPLKEEKTKVSIIEKLKKENKSIVLYVGKVSKGKGFDNLIKSFQKVSNNFPRAKLVVCGNRPNKKYRNTKSIIFLGFLSKFKLNYVYSKCDLVVVPSVWPEPLGWGTLDAGRFKKPIVASKIGGIPEAIIHKKTGILVERNDILALTNAIIYILKNNSTAKILGENANKFVLNKFGDKNVFKQLSKVYRDL